MWFTSPEIFSKLLSNRNRAQLAQLAQLAQIARAYFASLHEMAATSGRAPGNLWRSFETMERYGLVRSQKGARDKLFPSFPAAMCRFKWCCLRRCGTVT